MSRTMKTDRRDDLTFMQVVCAVCVVILHTNGCFWEYSSERYWITANIIECLCYFPVPIFFMISAITLIDFPEKYSLKEYFVRRVRKVIIPFVAWNLIGLGYQLVMGYCKIESITPQFLWEGFAGNTFVSIYWYFNAQICIYLSLPLFAVVKEEDRIRTFSYLAITAFMLNYFIPFIKRIFELGFSTPLNINAIGGYLIYIPLGIILDHLTHGKTKLASRIKMMICSLGVAGLLMHIIGTAVLSKEAGKVVSTYKGYINVPGILYSCAAFIVLEFIGRKFMRVSACRRLFRFLGKYTLEIYLLQYFIYDYLVTTFNINVRSLLYRLGMPLVVIPVAIAVTALIRKIPGLRKIVP